MKATQPQKIIWAVDPFETKGSMHAHLLGTLEKFSQTGASIEPVFVVSPHEYDFEYPFEGDMLEHIQPEAEKMLNHYLKDVTLPGLLPAKVLTELLPSLGSSVKRLVKYAKSVKADLIAVGAHSREGLPRFFIGSFSESLLLSSSVPTLVIGSRTGVDQLNKILFATDFGKKSEKLFLKVLALAKAQQAHIHLFHAVSHPVQNLFQSGVYLLGGGYVSVPEYMSDEEQKKRTIAEKFADHARKVGVPVTVTFDISNDSTADSINRYAEKENVNLIAMAAESGALSSALIGSITRQVVRNAPSPVWVYRSRL